MEQHQVYLNSCGKTSRFVSLIYGNFSFSHQLRVFDKLSSLRYLWLWITSPSEMHFCCHC